MVEAACMEELSCRLTRIASIELDSRVRQVLPGPGHGDVSLVDRNSLQILDVSTGHRRSVVEEEGLSRASWSADGRVLCVEMWDPPDEYVYVAYPAEDRVVKLLDSDAIGYDSSRPARERCPCYPRLSPDGRSVSFCRQDDEEDIDLPPFCNLWIADVPSGKVRRLSREWLMESAWSPDGERLACMRYVKYAENQSLVVLGQQGQLLREIDSPYYLHEIQWSPGGEWLLARGFEREPDSGIVDGFWWSTGPTFMVLTSIKTGKSYRVIPPEDNVNLCCWMIRPRTLAYTLETAPNTLIVAEVEGLENE